MTLEDIKRDSDHLRGALIAELQESSDAFGDESTQILKFHGIYQQDDRDLRRGADRTYVMMVRASLPGGVLSAEQYLVADGLADWAGDGTLRITTRQGLQWHHIRKGPLRPLIWLLNRSLVTTLGACGDVVRNVVACPSPDGVDLSPWADRIAERFRPRTSAYYEVWIDGSRTLAAEEPQEEPLYGDAYLPRKFKIGIAKPGDNCIDVYTHDVGLVAIPGQDGGVEAFTVLVGGGQGRTANKPETYPRLADPLTTVPADQVLDVVEAIVVVQRDNGNRENRKQARLKYLVDRWGLSRFRSEVEAVLGWQLPAAVAVPAAGHRDHLGWTPTQSGWWLGIHVENGRIADGSGVRLRSALHSIIDRFRPDVRLTAQQNLILCGVADSDRDEIDRILDEHGVTPAHEQPPVIRDSMACVALPTCGLALADAERAMPAVVRDVAALLDEFELGSEDLGIRMTGCANGCARPYSTEIGLIGHGKDRYDIRIGGALDGTRLNTTYVESVRAASIAETLRPLVAAWAADRVAGESFGDFSDRWLAHTALLEEAAR